MARLFDVVRELSGQGSVISTPRPYIKFCEGNHTHAAVLSQLVFWSSTKPNGEWFYKSNDELGEELCLSCDQVRYAIRQLKKRLDGVIHSRVKKANGVPTTHYQIDGNKLVDLLFPKNEQDPQMEVGKLPERNESKESEHNSQMETVILPDGNGSITNSTCEYSQIHGSGNITESINRSKPDTNKQIVNVPSQLETASSESPVLFSIPLKGKTKVYEVTQSELFEMRELYPAVDVAQQIRNMIGWCKANPTRQKTSSGIKRFMHQWLSKEQDKGYGKPVNSQAQQEQPSEQDSIKKEIARLEREADAIGIQISQSKSWGATQQAIESFERQQTNILAKRSELLSQLGGAHGQ
ncbi:MAG: ATPase [Vibrio litoralis]|uniref:ATPase n=1 Tax=Vibrio litoralis TaxID=335972 RepID=UPI003F9C3C56